MRRWLVLMLVACVGVTVCANGDEIYSVDCLVFSVEGKSSEANSLFQRYMAIQPELLRGYAPSQFTAGADGYSVSTEGKFGYSAANLEPLERYGDVVLNAAKVSLRTPERPKAWKRATVEIEVAELAAQGGMVQPAIKAIQLGAAKLKLKKGWAWVERTTLVSPGKIKAEVCFSK